MQWTHGLGSRRLDPNQQLGTRLGPFLCPRQFAWRPHGDLDDIFSSTKNGVNPVNLNKTYQGTWELVFFGQKHETCTTTTPKEKGYRFLDLQIKSGIKKQTSRDFDLQLKVDADLQSSVTITKPTSMLQNASYKSLPFSCLSRHICRRCSAVLDYVSRPQLHISTHPTSLPHWKEKAIGKWPSHHPSS